MATNFIEMTEEERMMAFYPRTDEKKDFFNYHPTTTPRGMRYYDKFVLNAKQQNELNMFKANMAKENHQYMEGHPEIRAMVVLFLRSFLKKSQQHMDVRTEAAKFFSRHRSDIEKEIEAYLDRRDEKVTKDFDKHEAAASVSVEPPSTPSSKMYTFSTWTDEYFSESTIGTEGYEGDMWGPPSDWIRELVVPSLQTVEEEEKESEYVPPPWDEISPYTSSSYMDATIPSVPDVTSISTGYTSSRGGPRIGRDIGGGVISFASDRTLKSGKLVVVEKTSEPETELELTIISSRTADERSGVRDLTNADSIMPDAQTLVVVEKTDDKLPSKIEVAIIHPGPPGTPRLGTPGTLSRLGTPGTPSQLGTPGTVYSARGVPIDAARLETVGPLYDAQGLPVDVSRLGELETVYDAQGLPIDVASLEAPGAVYYDAQGVPIHPARLGEFDTVYDAQGFPIDATQIEAPVQYDAQGFPLLLQKVSSGPGKIDRTVYSRAPGTLYDGQGFPKDIDTSEDRDLNYADLEIPEELETDSEQKTSHRSGKSDVSKAKAKAGALSSYRDLGNADMFIPGAEEIDQQAKTTDKSGKVVAKDSKKDRAKSEDRDMKNADSKFRIESIAVDVMGEKSVFSRGPVTRLDAQGFPIDEEIELGTTDYSGAPGTRYGQSGAPGSVYYDAEGVLIDVARLGEFETVYDAQGLPIDFASLAALELGKKGPRRAPKTKYGRLGEPGIVYYDAQGNPIDATRLAKFSTVYDDKGVPIDVAKLGEFGTVYDDKGRPIDAARLGALGTVYDKQGLPIDAAWLGAHETLYDAQGHIQFGSLGTVYDAQGLPIDFTRLGALGPLYDAQGLPIDADRLRALRQLGTVYEAQGLPIDADRLGATGTIYDAQGSPIDPNWIGALGSVYDSKGTPIDLAGLGALGTVYDAQGLPIDAARLGTVYDAQGIPIDAARLRALGTVYDAQGNPIDLTRLRAAARHEELVRTTTYSRAPFPIHARHSGKMHGLSAHSRASGRRHDAPGYFTGADRPRDSDGSTPHSRASRTGLPIDAPRLGAPRAVYYDAQGVPIHPARLGEHGTVYDAQGFPIDRTKSDASRKVSRTKSDYRAGDVTGEGLKRKSESRASDLTRRVVMTRSSTREVDEKKSATTGGGDISDLRVRSRGSIQRRPTESITRGAYRSLEIDPRLLLPVHWFVDRDLDNADTIIPDKVEDIYDDDKW